MCIAVALASSGALAGAWTPSINAASAPYPTAVLPDAPVGYWRLGEPSGSVAQDASGKNNNGSFTNGITLGATSLLTGDSNPAVKLDGSNDAVSVPDSTSLDLPSKSFTLEAWIDASSYNNAAGGGYPRIINKGQDADHGYALMVAQDPGANSGKAAHRAPGHTPVGPDGQDDAATQRPLPRGRHLRWDRLSAVCQWPVGCQRNGDRHARHRQPQPVADRQSW